MGSADKSLGEGRPLTGAGAREGFWERGCLTQAWVGGLCLGEMDGEQWTCQQEEGKAGQSESWAPLEWVTVLSMPSGPGHSHQQRRGLHQSPPVSTSPCSHLATTALLPPVSSFTPSSTVHVLAEGCPHQRCLLWSLLSDFSIPASHSLSHYPQLKKNITVLITV